jgi:class 3 adenylate cyclase/tetratricopeptide (TPR) repeat protein
VLFCDLVGSTELSTRLDAESLRTVLSQYFARLRTAAERHGGSVEKFIGDAVMVVFGIPRAHEDDALRAIRAAADMRSAIEELSVELQRDLGVPLATRIGVNTGEVVAGDPSTGETLVTGAPLNLAARLEQAAGTNEIFVGEDTFRVARDAVSTEPLEPFLVKGFDEPVRAHRLLAVFPDELGHARHFDSPLVDREPEQALLQQAFDRVVSGRRCQLFTILGPPGIGKSRLVEEFVARSGRRVQCLRGRCLPYGDGITYWPIAQIVEQATGLTGADDRAASEAKIARLVSDVERGELVAERIGQVLGITAGTPSPDETQWAIRRLFEVLARTDPLVLVFDDIHWGEPTFLDLIEHVADRSRDASIMLLSVARPELLEARPTWGGGKLNTTTVLLDPLETDDVDTLLRNLLGGSDLAPDVRSRIVELAGGYPLFVEEIVSELIENELIVRKEDGWEPTADIGSLSLPATISGLLASRLDRLGEGERSAIERASLIGKDFSAAEVASLTPAGLRDSVGNQLLTLVHKELIRPAPSRLPDEDAFTFRHMLIRDVAYEGMAKQSRADLHETYAGWLEARTREGLDEYEEIVGYHFAQAQRYLLELGPADERTDRLGARAGARFATAGLRASARGDMPATVKLLGHVAAIMDPDDPARIAILPALADGLVQGGDIRRAESLLDEMSASAARIGDPVLEARARLERYAWQVITDPVTTTGPELQSVTERAVLVFEEHDADEHLAAALEALAMAHRVVTGDISAMAEAAERGLNVARRSGSRAAAMSSAANLAAALVMGSMPFEAALSRLDELIDSFSGEPMAQAAIGLEAASTLGQLERFTDANDRLASSEAVFDELGQERWRAETLKTRGLIEWWAGDPAAGESQVRAAFDLYRARHELADAGLAGLDLALLLCDLGRMDEAETLARDATKETLSYALEPRIQSRRVAAKVAAKRGNVDEALQQVAAAERLVETTELLMLQAEVRADAAELLLLAERRDDAERMAVNALASAERKGSRVIARRASASLALAGGRTS